MSNLVRSLGADYVFDYKNEDFTDSNQRYDLILDNVGSRSFADYRRMLAPQGVHLPNTGHAGMRLRLQGLLVVSVDEPAPGAVPGRTQP